MIKIENKKKKKTGNAMKSESVSQKKRGFLCRRVMGHLTAFLMVKPLSSPVISGEVFLFFVFLIK